MDRRGVIVYRRVLVGGSIGVGMMVKPFFVCFHIRLFF